MKCSCKYKAYCGQYSVKPGKTHDIVIDYCGDKLIDFTQPFFFYFIDCSKRMGPVQFKRYCKMLRLRNDARLIEAYKNAHLPGAEWIKIAQGMREVGILDMEIYAVGEQLFMIMETVPDFDHDAAMRELAIKPRQAEWESYMSAFQHTNGSSAAEKWQLLTKIYKLGE